ANLLSSLTITRRGAASLEQRASPLNCISNPLVVGNPFTMSGRGGPVIRAVITLLPSSKTTTLTGDLLKSTAQPDNVTVFASFRLAPSRPPFKSEDSESPSRAAAARTAASLDMTCLARSSAGDGGVINQSVVKNATAIIARPAMPTSNFDFI